jgi:hypothetical protein
VLLWFISLVLVDLEVDGVLVGGAGVLALGLLLSFVHDGLLLLLQRLAQHNLGARLLLVLWMGKFIKLIFGTRQEIFAEVGFLK